MTSGTSDIAAPDGTMTATKFVEPGTLLPCGASGVSLGVLTYIPGGLQAGLSYTLSVWLRGANGGESINIGLNDCISTDVTLSTSWQRYTATYSALSAGVASCEGSRGFQMRDVNSPNATYYVWGAQTEQAASAGPYVATGSTTQTLHYYSADHLGTTTVVTDALGNLQNDSDYYPFGTENPITASDSNHYKFTGYERDLQSGETGLDYAQARYYTSALGRFMSPDPSGLYYANSTNPQSFNLYSYAFNNPLRFIDPSGLIPCDYGPGEQEDADSDEECTSNGGTVLVDPPTTIDVHPNGDSTCSGNCPSPIDEFLYKLVSAMCGSIPSGRVVGGTAAAGPVFGNVVIGGEAVLNYNSGQTSLFGYFGFQVGCCNFASGGGYTALAYGLSDDNSNYSGGFTSVNGSYGPFSASVSRSSNGLDGPLSIAPPGTEGAVTSVGYGAGQGEGVNSQVTGFVAATTYSNPVQAGQFTGFKPSDYLAYGAKQVCKSKGF